MIDAMVLMLQFGLAMAPRIRAATSGMLGRLARFVSSSRQFRDMSVMTGVGLVFTD